MSRFNLVVLMVLLLTVSLGGYYLSGSHKTTRFSQENALPVQAERTDKLSADDPNIAQARQAQQAKLALDDSISAAKQQSSALGHAVADSQKYQQEVINKGTRVARLTQGLAIASNLKVHIMAYFYEHNKWPQSNQMAGAASPESYSKPPYGSAVIHSANVLPDGKIMIQFAPENDATEHLWLHATGTDPQEIHWQCTSPDMRDIGELISQCKYE